MPPRQQRKSANAEAPRPPPGGGGSDAESSSSSDTDGIGPGSGSSSRSSSPSSSSDGGASPPGGPGPYRAPFGLSYAARQQSAVLTRLRLARAHQLRRRLSLRHVAEPVALDRGKPAAGRAGGPTFFEKGRCLSDSDAAVLATFSNGRMFDRLLRAVAGEAAAQPALERALAAANPLFRLGYVTVVPDALPAPPAGAPGPSPLLTAAHAAESTARRDRTAALPPVSRRAAPVADAVGNAAQDDGASAQRGGKRPLADSGGLVARSRRDWEAHLAATLTAEGETVEGYRSRKASGGYLDTAQFRQDAQWSEFLRERKLEEEQREQAAKRAIRRGEAER